MSVKRYTIRFTGRVQGVGFRLTTVRVADDFDIAGWVRNEADGSVQCVAEGATDELDRFVAAIQQRMGGNIADTSISSGSPTNEFSGFTIR